jgi:hypothetical protein
LTSCNETYIISEVTISVTRSLRALALSSRASGCTRLSLLCLTILISRARQPQESRKYTSCISEV